MYRHSFAIDIGDNRYLPIRTNAPMRIRDQRRKIRLLEEEIKELRNKSNSNSPLRTRVLTGFLRLSRFLTRHQFLFTLLAGVITIIYIQSIYKIDPFESYRNTATTKDLSVFYQKLGDELMFRQSWPDAEKAYKAALALQPNNSEAALGLTKVQIFTPSEGQKYADTEIVDAKINYLIDLFPDDEDLHYLRAVSLEDRVRFSDQVELFKISIDRYQGKDRAFNPLIELGYVCMKNGDLDCAGENFQKALDLQPNSHIANNNFGNYKMLTLDFQAALEHFARAGVTSTRAIALINIGDAYKYLGNASEALTYYQSALDQLDEEVSEEEHTVKGAWLYRFMPRSKGDGEMLKYQAIFFSREQKKIMAHYFLSIDYALLNDFISAEKEFKIASELDKKRQYSNFFLASCMSTNEILKPSAKVKAWFKKSSAKIRPDFELCKRIDRCF